MKEDKNRTLKTVGALLIFVVIIIIILAFLLFNGHETRTSEDDDNEPAVALECTAGDLKDAFFTSSTANTIKNRIKIIFDNDKPEKFYYSYEGTYRSNSEADQSQTDLHIKYDNHMAEYGLDNGLLSPTYSTVKNRTQINLYAKSHQVFSRGVDKLFFIKEDDLYQFLDYSRDQVIDYYEKQGFSCEKQG